MLDEAAPVSRESLDRLAAYLPILEAPDADFASIAGRFIEDAYEFGWVRSFDWPSWKGTDEAISLRDDPAALDVATPLQLVRLLTTVIRQDRFVDGAVVSALAAGFLTAIARRAAAITGAQSEG